MTEWWKRNNILLPPLFFDITYPSYNACQLHDVCHHPTTLFPNDSMASIYTMISIDAILSVNNNQTTNQNIIF